MTDFNMQMRLDDKPVQLLFDGLIRAMDDMSPVMADLAEAFLHSTQDRFDSHTSPDGQPWVALTPDYAARKAKRGQSGGLLFADGRLRGELRSEWGRDFSEVSTAPLVYAAIHQEGGTPDMPAGPAAVPARPYMGLSPEDEREAEEIVGDWLGRVSRGVR